MIRDAGLSALHSLPLYNLFGNLAHQLDYRPTQILDFRKSFIHGIEVELINAYLKKTWVKAAFSGSLDGLYQINKEWQGYDVTFFLGPPQIAAICKREVYLVFDVTKIVLRSQTECVPFTLVALLRETCSNHIYLAVPFCPLFTVGS